MTVLMGVIEDAFRQVLEVSKSSSSKDLSKLGQVLRDIQPVIVEATTIEDIEEILARGSKNIPIRSGWVKKQQGYVGRFMMKEGEPLVYSIASAYEDGKLRPAEIDPIQEAFGEDSYVAMLPVKAARALAFANCPDRYGNIEEFLAELDLSLGCTFVVQGPGHRDYFAATGFQPDKKTRAFLERLNGGALHLAAEDIEAFQGSGFCDQLMALKAAGWNELEHPSLVAVRTVEFPGLWN